MLTNFRSLSGRKVRLQNQLMRDLRRISTMRANAVSDGALTNRTHASDAEPIKGGCESEIKRLLYISVYQCPSVVDPLLARLAGR